MYNRGRCTLEIGPHVFMDTTVFEVHYHPVPVPVASPTTFVYQSMPSGSWQSNPQSSQANETTSTALPTSTPLLASLPSTLHVTQTLVSQVNQAAASNPTLANLLQLAVAGKASPDQLKTLGLLIQSLASSPSAAVDSTQPSTDPTRSTAHFDLVLEFRENPADRWTFPRGPSKCEFVTLPGISGPFGDIILTTAGAEGVSEIQTIPRQVIAFRFKSAGSAVWDTISRWVGPNIEENCKVLSSIKPLERKYLGAQTPGGPRAFTNPNQAAVPSYSMKPIKPATESSRSRRKTVRRSVADSNVPGSPTAKRKRPTQNKNQIEPPRIACHSCGQSEVPLIQGGRYCRPCVNDGREPVATSDLPAARKVDQHLLQPTPQPATTATMVPSTDSNANAIDDPNT
ncbi:hypothetical protein BKA83DRAFT_671263 [Pisolithus microcarpus]|nr:hypothetical protein BKA83DRAFT_671263 [Pisolithus microcarpus]